MGRWCGCRRQFTTSFGEKRDDDQRHEGGSTKTVAPLLEGLLAVPGPVECARSVPYQGPGSALDDQAWRAEWPLGRMTNSREGSAWGRAHAELFKNI